MDVGTGTSCIGVSSEPVLRYFCSELSRCMFTIVRKQQLAKGLANSLPAVSSEFGPAASARNSRSSWISRVPPYK
eukprot:976126-Amphidinium_carterae.1